MKAEVEKIDLQSELIQVLDWYIGFYNDVRAEAPEYFERCYDLNSTEYLYSEAVALREIVKEKLIFQ